MHHTAITVRSLAESIRFYSEIFGLTVEQQGERSDLGCKIVMMKDTAGHRLELFEFTNPNPRTSEIELAQEGITHIAFEVEDIEKTAADFTGKGFQPEVITGAIAKYFFIKDPTGIPIEIYQKK